MESIRISIKTIEDILKEKTIKSDKINASILRTFAKNILLKLANFRSKNEKEFNDFYDKKINKGVLYINKIK